MRFPDAETARAAVESLNGAEGKSCPSAPCIEGALLIGVTTPSGRLAYFQPPARVDAQFVDHAEAEGHPERRYRFSLPCIEAGCSQWTGSGCGLADHLVEHDAVDHTPAKLPGCGIRRTCRWYSQRGAEACAVCPLVVADCGGTATYRSTREAAQT
jgi:hypothetical protein